MIYLHVTLQVQRGKMDEWSSAYEKEFLPLCQKYGERLVGAWRTVVGTYDEVTDLYAFDSLAEMEKVRATMFQDPEMIDVLKRGTPLSGLEVSKLMVPLPYSPMK